MSRNDLGPLLNSVFEDEIIRCVVCGCILGENLRGFIVIVCRRCKSVNKVVSQQKQKAI